MEVFRDILNKERLERRDLELIIRKIKVYEDRLEIQLQADVDSILRSGTLSEGAAEEAAVAAMAEVPEGTVNFKARHGTYLTCHHRPGGKTASGQGVPCQCYQ